MKKLFIALFVLGAFSAQAQKNALLDQAFWKNRPDVAAIQAEIAKGANPAETTSNMFDPVVYAINAQAPDESIKFLLDQKGNEVNKITHDSRTYIFWAAMRGNTNVMEYLLSKAAKTDIMDSHGATPLTFAAGGGQANTKVY
ncbi:MAG: ankyrin repeat domain-containing protein, partial [Chryseobacterium sp.]